MKSHRLILPLVFVLLAAAAYAQTAAPSDAQKAFTQLKSLAGAWNAAVTVDPPMPQMGNDDKALVTLRITSRGNAIVHEMRDPSKPDDPAKYDHPVTMFYVDDGDHLSLVHYCDAGNRPHMVAKASPDGKSIDFDFVDLTGSTKYGHMNHAKFTFVDANHHIEDWTYMMPGDKPVHAHFDLKRAQ